MIKKIRYKFISILMISLTLLLLFMVISINWVNFNSITKSTDKILDVLASNDGDFTHKDNNIIIDDYNLSSETPFETRYFLVRLPSLSTSMEYIKETKVVEFKQINKNTLSDNQINEMVLTTCKRNKDRNYYQNFRYKLTSSENEYMIIYLDCTKQLIPIDNFFKISILVISIGLLISFIIIFYVSKLIVKPIEDSNAKQKKFITDAGHELKTPLTIISANNELQEMISGENEMTQTISKEVKRMTSMVKKITELSQLSEEERLSNSEISVFSISDVVYTSCSDVFNVFKNKNISFKFSNDKDIYIQGNNSKIQELISIILDNAFKYSLTTCNIKLYTKNDKVILIEKNDCKDIKEGNYDKVFSRFYRSDEVRASDIEGSGIGLSIAKEIVNLNNGSIKAYGDKESFFNIEVILPLIKNKKNLKTENSLNSKLTKKLCFKI